jgi:hypothetical protein
MCGSFHSFVAILLRILTFTLLSTFLLGLSPASAQFENPPPELQATLNGIAPGYASTPRI